MTHDTEGPKRLDFGATPERAPGRLEFDARASNEASARASTPVPASVSAPAPVPVPARPAPKPLDLGPSTPGRGSPGGPAADAGLGRALFPAFASRVEVQIRHLVPLKLATVATFGDTVLASSGDLVEAIAATTREFNELGAADTMAHLLAQVTRRTGMFERWFRGAAGGEIDYRAALGALKQSLSFFPGRTEAFAAQVRQAEESLVIAMAALGSVADTVPVPGDDAGLARVLDDRRRILTQAVQQIRMQPAQLRGLEERVVDLLSRADHLMNVVLPAAVAARPRG